MDMAPARAPGTQRRRSRLSRLRLGLRLTRKLRRPPPTKRILGLCDCRGRGVAFTSGGGYIDNSIVACYIVCYRTTEGVEEGVRLSAKLYYNYNVIVIVM